MSSLGNLWLYPSDAGYMLCAIIVCCGQYLLIRQPCPVLKSLQKTFTAKTSRHITEERVNLNVNCPDSAGRKRRGRKTSSPLQVLIEKLQNRDGLNNILLKRG